MSRQALRQTAEETLQILRRGSYRAPSGRKVHVADALARSVAGTVLHTPGDLDGRVRAITRSTHPGRRTAHIEVTAETTLAAARRLGGDGTVPLALSFASAKNPGGGFLTGAQAQEEGLARASGLYASLQAAPDFYALHRAVRDPLYTDHAVWSPDVPVFRDDAGRLLEEPYPVAFLTAPAPNRGAVGDPQSLARLPGVLAARARKVLAAAHTHGHRTLVLGAWGCGVFRNDPAEVARAFAAPLRGSFAGLFDRVTFAVWDPAPGSPRRRAFEAALADLVASGSNP